MLDHGSPTAGNVPLQVFILHIIKIDFLVLVFSTPDHPTGIGIGCSQAACGFLAAALQLLVQITVPGLGGGIFHLVLNFNKVTVRLKNIDFAKFHTLWANPLQDDTYHPLTILHHATFVCGVMIGGFNQNPLLWAFTGKTCLGNKQLGQRIVHEPERHIRFFGFHWILEQIDLAQITALGINHRT